MCRQFLQREAAPGAMYTLTFAGAVMFFMLWEAGKRYNICFTGVCLLLMAEGADGFTNTVFNKGDAWLKAHFNGMRLHAARLVVLAVGLFCFAGSFAAANQLSHPRTYVEIPYFNSKRGKDEEPIRWRYHKNPKVLEQTIDKGSWNGVIVGTVFDCISGILHQTNRVMSIVFKCLHWTIKRFYMIRRSHQIR